MKPITKQILELFLTVGTVTGFLVVLIITAIELYAHEVLNTCLLLK